MNNSIDLLQIKVDKAKMMLPEETRQAIDAVSWRDVILGMRKSKGYSFEQLGDLEVETELLLCGLLDPKDYPGELEKRMGIPKDKVNELVEEMNQLVFSRIREELIKNKEQKETAGSGPKVSSVIRKPETNYSTLQINQDEADVLDKAGIRIIPDLNTPEISAPTHPILGDKLSSSFKIQSSKTEHELGNLSKTSQQNAATIKNKIDPYREIPE